MAYLVLNLPEPHPDCLQLSPKNDRPSFSTTLFLSSGLVSATWGKCFKSAEKGQTLNIAAYHDVPSAVKAAVANGTGGLLYEESIRPDVQRGTFKILNPAGLKLYSHSFIVYHKERPLSANASEFLKLLRRRKRHTSQN